MGILNLGPAAGIGLIAYFRGLGAAFGQPPKLRSDGPADDPHPADIVRGYLAALRQSAKIVDNRARLREQQQETADTRQPPVT